MTPARTRTVDDDRERERVVDDYCTQGFDVVEQGERTTVLRRRDHGGVGAHALVFILLGWWTFGAANLIYALYRRVASQEGVVVRVDADAEREVDGDD